MKSLKEFIQKHKITMDCEYADSNPLLVDDEWAKKAHARHWKCTLKRGKKRLSVPFSQGCGIAYDPDAENVLNSLRCDSEGLDQAFESWASDLGFDTDSRKAHRLFLICKKQKSKLEKFLGAELFEELKECEPL